MSDRPVILDTGVAVPRCVRRRDTDASRAVDRRIAGGKRFLDVDQLIAAERRVIRGAKTVANTRDARIEPGVSPV